MSRLCLITPFLLLLALALWGCVQKGCPDEPPNFTLYRGCF